VRPTPIITSLGLRRAKVVPRSLLRLLLPAFIERVLADFAAFGLDPGTRRGCRALAGAYPSIHFRRLSVSSDFHHYIVTIHTRRGRGRTASSRTKWVTGSKADSLVYCRLFRAEPASKDPLKANIVEPVDEVASGDDANYCGYPQSAD
jgi:hypothetical protein